MAHKKAGGSSRNGRDSQGQRLGVKKFGDESVVAGNIIIRQRGTTYHPGVGVGLGRDYTIFATVDGQVKYSKKAGNKNVVSVVAAAATEAKKPAKKAPAKTAAA
ncbi:MAG: 50S ribosomal protein L27 [Rickettsiales bacterium]